jgi:non-homologous end joining protein Ku
MVTILKIGLVQIPIQLVNVVKNRYSVSPIHLFSSCCNSSVKNKQICGSCSQQLTKDMIKRGLDEKNILSKEQEDRLKELNENNVLEVMSIKDITETTFYDLIPFIQKCQEVTPSISKGYKKSNIVTFYSFLSALKDLNKYAICKLVSRGLEHIGLLIHYKEKVMFIEVPFSQYLEIDNKEIEKVIQFEKLTNLESFKPQAIEFITSYKSKVNEVNEIIEEKKTLLKFLLENGEKETETDEVKVNNDNPFL